METFNVLPIAITPMILTYPDGTGGRDGVNFLLLNIKAKIQEVKENLTCTIFSIMVFRNMLIIFLEWLTDLSVASLTWKSEGYFKRLSSIETFERP